MCIGNDQGEDKPDRSVKSHVPRGYEAIRLAHQENVNEQNGQAGDSSGLPFKYFLDRARDRMPFLPRANPATQGLWPGSWGDRAGPIKTILY
ncbi:MAG: hypothetical protein A2Z14_04730 [Chloroflexi bacterium RBG_16_48_8]|nr:MAG: hypothetical protein A2Z14_04730 [Chloroflexi bacterium RBG_16_48_8]